MSKSINLLNKKISQRSELKPYLKKGIRLIDYLEKFVELSNLLDDLGIVGDGSKIGSQIKWEKEIRAGKFKIVYNKRSFFIGVNYLLRDNGAQNEAQLLYYPQADAEEPQVNLNYEVLYEDDYYFVVAKPANLPVHPCGSYFHHTLTSLVSKSYDYFSLNRLDSETSGIIFFAKQKKEIDKLTAAFLKADKFYLALVHGIFPSFKKVALPLDRLDNSLVHKKRGYKKDGKASLTYFRALVKSDKYSLVLAHPKTGRTHQIRAHLSEVGFPVVGDKIYGKDERYFLDFYDNGMSQALLGKLELEQHFLHCYKCIFYHPFLNKTLVVKCPLPSDKKKILSKKLDKKLQGNCFRF